MAITEALRLLITADTAGAVRGIQNVGNATDKALGRSQKNLDRWGRGLTTLGAGMVAFGTVSLVGLGRAAKASEEANLAVVKLENTLSNMPLLAGENSKAFIDLANSIQDKTAADADAIVEAEAMLGTFNLTGQEIRKITPLVVDYARKFGVDMVSAAVQVGKALDGNVGALKRNGVSIDEVMFKTDRYGAVQKALSDQVGGFAEAEGATFAGSLERLKNELGDVAEGVGVGAVDAFSDLFGIIDAGADKLNELSPATQSMIGKVATFGSVALVAAGSLSFTIGQVIKMRQNFLLAQDAVVAFAGSGGLGRLARAGLVVGGLIAIREVLLALEDDLNGIDVSTLENELLDLAETGKISGNQLKQVFDGFADAIDSGDPQKVEAIADQLGEVDKALAQLAARDPESAAAAFRFISDALIDLGASRGQIKGFFDDYMAAVAAADTASRIGADGSDELAGAMGGAADATGEATSALQEYADELKAQFDPQFAMIDAIQKSAEAQAELRDATAALTEARASGDVEAIAEAEDRYSEAVNGARGSVVDLKSAALELKDSMEASGDSAADVTAKFVDLAMQQGFTEKEALTMAAAFGVATDEANTLGRTDPNVRVSETGNRSTQTQLRRTKNEAFAIPARRNTNVTATGTNTARIRILQVRDALGQLHNKTLTIGVTAALSGQAVAIMNNKMFRAAGGPVSEGMPYIVGEKGPEWFVPGADGQIFPHGATFPATVAGGAGYVDNRTINITTGADPQSVVAALRRAGEIGLPITLRGRSL